MKVGDLMFYTNAKGGVRFGVKDAKEDSVATNWAVWDDTPAGAFRKQGATSLLTWANPDGYIPLEML